MKMTRMAVWVVGLAAIASAMAQVSPDLTGRVVNSDGTPIPEASIFIYTAGPRVGPGYI